MDKEIEVKLKERCINNFLRDLLGKSGFPFPFNPQWTQGSSGRVVNGIFHRESLSSCTVSIEVPSRPLPYVVEATGEGLLSVGSEAFLKCLVHFYPCVERLRVTIHDYNADPSLESDMLIICSFDNQRGYEWAAWGQDKNTFVASMLAHFQGLSWYVLTHYAEEKIQKGGK